MALEAARQKTLQENRSRSGGAARWRSAMPALLLAATLAISVIGLYALGRSLQDWASARNAAPAATASAEAEPPQSLAQLAKSLTRVGWSQQDVPVDIMLVSPAYFAAVGWARTSALNPDTMVVFLVTENVHDEDLPPFAPPLAYVNDDVVLPISEKVMADSPHHRTVAVSFPRDKMLAVEPLSLQLLFPSAGDQATILRWDDPPLTEGVAAVGGAFHLTTASIFALLGGLVVSMWPCLFQLTAYFIPSLAGISMGEARGPVTPARRLRVVKMATFFVAGFVIVYTLAGAAAGLAAQSFDTQSAFETWRRPLTIISGLSMLLLAVRQAARARLPLVCRMPLMTPKPGKTPGYGTAMVMGLAYATGCATCFGAAVLLGMLVYVGVAGAPLAGAAVMFLFSVGMGIPLIIGSALMAQVLPLLERMLGGARYLSLASAAMMLGMAILLLTDRFMGFSNFISQSAG